MQKRPRAAALFIAQIHIWIMHCLIIGPGADLEQDDRLVRAILKGMAICDSSLEDRTVTASQDGFSILLTQNNTKSRRT